MDRKIDCAQRVYASLRRPDGSLPVFGDSGDETYPLGPPVAAFDSERRAQKLAYAPEWRPTEANSVFPVSGLSVWWEGLELWPNAPDLSQTVVTWSNFAGHGHKHADEMSVLFWAGGQTWWSNVGYWPYGNEARADAESWAGSNAPHLVDENSVAPRVN